MTHSTSGEQELNETPADAIRRCLDQTRQDHRVIYVFREHLEGALAYIARLEQDARKYTWLCDNCLGIEKTLHGYCYVRISDHRHSDSADYPSVDALVSAEMALSSSSGGTE